MELRGFHLTDSLAYLASQSALFCHEEIVNCHRQRSPDESHEAGVNAAQNRNIHGPAAAPQLWPAQG